jgi:hypothetical protein
MSASRYAFVLAGAALVATSICACANDGTTELATGGLMFVRGDNLEMLSQHITISPSEIGIRYRLLNKSDRDVTVLISFPLPDIHVEGPDETVALPSDDPVNLLSFSTAVNGKAVSAGAEQRALSAGLDRTQLLRRLGIPLAPHLVDTHDALDRLAPDKWEELRRIGVAEVEEQDSGGGVKRHLAPRWALQTTFFWEQTFPAKTEIMIEHRYKPSVGQTDQTLLGAPNEMKEPWYEEYKDKYCFSYELLATLERARKAANSRFGAPFSEQRIDYVHKTWVNGLGTPIGEFRLTVDKGVPDNLVSFCGEEAQRISDTQLEVKRSDYTPDGNIAVLFLSKKPRP